MLRSKLVQQLLDNFPKRYREEVCKYVFLIGFDKAVKKGLFSMNDTVELKKYATKIKSRGRIYQYEDGKDQSLKKELANLKDEIHKLSNHIQNQQKPTVHTVPDNQLFVAPQNIPVQIQRNVQSQKDLRKRSASYDYKKLQKNPKFQAPQAISYFYPPKSKSKNREITPKVTEVVPNQIYQNFNINIQKHHLDDTEIKQALQDQYSRFSSGHKSKPIKPVFEKVQPQLRSQSSHMSIQIAQQLQQPQQDQIQQSIQQYQDDDEYDIEEEIDKYPVKELQQNKKTLSHIASPQFNEFKMNHSRKSLETVLEVNQSKEQQSLASSHSQVHKFSSHSNKSQQEKLKLKQKQKDYNPSIQSKENSNTRNTNAISKIKEQVEEDRKKFKCQQEQQQDENCSNAANFTHKASSALMSQPFSQQKLIQSKQPPSTSNNNNNQIQKLEEQYHKFGDNLYKSTVTSVLNDENSNQSINHFQNQDSQQQPSSQYSQSLEEQQYHKIKRPGSLSGQYTKRSQYSKEQSKGDISFVNSPQVVIEQRRQEILKENMNKFEASHNYPYSPSIHPHFTNFGTQKDVPQNESKSRNYSQPDNNKTSNDNDYNRSSVSSTFSMFNPNEELKTFFQNDFLERKKLNQADQMKRSSASSSNVSDFDESKRKNANSKFISQSSQFDEQPNFRKKNLDYSYDQIEKSNVFNNNRLSVTRILNNSQV